MEGTKGILGIQIATEEEARVRYKLARLALLAARVRFSELESADNKKTLDAAKKELSAASLFTHEHE